MAREIPQPVTLEEMRQEGAQGGAEIADALMDLLASAPDFSPADLEPELRERFAAWMRAMGQLLATDKNLSSLHLRAWSEAAEEALEERLRVYRNIAASGRTSV